jgi:hypothetical protein
LMRYRRIKKKRKDLGSLRTSIRVVSDVCEPPWGGLR